MKTNEADLFYFCVYIFSVLVENAMDSLLELSVAAEGAAPGPSPISGFEHTVSALLNPQPDSKSEPDSSDHPRSLSADPLREEQGLLVDQERETQTMQQKQGSSWHTSSLPAHFITQQVLPELLQSSLQPGSRGPLGNQVEQKSGTSSPIDQLSTWDDKSTKNRKSLADFTQLMAEAPTDMPKPPLDLGASGRPSAFQVYKKQQPLQTPSASAAAADPNAAVGGARAKVSVLTQEPGYSQPRWNIEAPVFTPHAGQNHGPAFITPVARLPSDTLPWPTHSPIRQAPLRPSATIPKSWALSAPQSPAHHSRLRLQGRVLVLLRGAPGSGKSTLAR